MCTRSRWPGRYWCHGDFAEWTKHGGLIIHGRSDATLNPGGVRIGTAEIYAQVEQIPDVMGQDYSYEALVRREREEAQRTSYVLHRHEEAPAVTTVQITTGVTATQKRVYDINVHAGSVAEALALIDEAERGMRERYG